MYSDVISASVCGLEATLVHVEADVGMGLPVFEMSGFLGTEVREARERVRVAIKNAGIELRPQRIVINISPANIRKDGTGFDLPIALSILAANQLIEGKRLENILVIGELSLDGTIHGVRGILPCISAAVDHGVTTCIVPMENGKEAAIVESARILAVNSLKEVVDYLNGETDIKEQDHEDGVLRDFYIGNNRTMEKTERECEEKFKGESKKNDDGNPTGNYEDEYKEDYKDIRGQYIAKRATMIAVAGMHNLIYVGSPGSGKTMMAKRIPTIMPELSYEESLQVTKIYSVAGILEQGSGLVHQRPFRHPHHNITETALLGGGRIPRPGEVTLAGKGVLFLDELTEFASGALESLRQPLEDKEITIVRLNMAYTYPADFMLVAAINPCKCGYYPDRNRCNCSEHDIRRYMGKISTPMWDRFDLCVQTDEVSFLDLSSRAKDTEMSSQEMREKVERARQMQEKRFKGRKIDFNSQMTVKDMERFCVLDEEGKKKLEHMYQKLHLTARGYHKILKTARTIADLEEKEEMNWRHISEAMTFRNYQANM